MGRLDCGEKGMERNDHPVATCWILRRLTLPLFTKLSVVRPPLPHAFLPCPFTRVPRRSMTELVSISFAQIRVASYW